MASTICESPVLPVGVLMFAEQQCIKPPSLSDEEKNIPAETIDDALGET